MNEQRAYATPAAFRRALTDKLKGETKIGRWSLSQLQRYMAYDRLLERLYFDDEGWIIRGATALLARNIGVRATIDIDIHRNTARELAEAELRAAAVRGIGDWFGFEIGTPRGPAHAASAVRLPVTACIGGAP